MASTTQIYTDETLDGSSPGAQAAVKQAIVESAIKVQLNLKCPEGLPFISPDRSHLGVNIATSPRDLTAADAITQLAEVANFFAVPLSDKTDGEWSWESPALVSSGGFLYVWFDVPNNLRSTDVDGWVAEL